MLSNSEIRDWLESLGKDRVWLAAQCGTTKHTVDSWFSKRGFPKPALVIIEKLMRESSGSHVGPVTASFTISEFEEIEAARARTGSLNREQFYREAILDYARDILSTESKAKVSPFPSEERAAKDQKRLNTKKHH